MAASIRYEDRLDGISNYLQWKVRLSAVLKENKIYNYVSSVVAAPAADPVALDLHEVKEAKAQRIILDGVKDHLIPHLAEKKTAKEMWDALKNLFEAKNENWKMALKAKLHDTKMGKEESVSSYLTRVAQVKDELAVVGEVILDSELVRIALNGFTKDWEVFVKCVVGREHLPDWSRLWDDFTQEEIRERSQSSDQKTDRVDENVALVAKSKKKGSSARDLSKVRCFCCNKLGHLASQCPERKKKKKESEEPETPAIAAIEDFASKFDREFSLVTLVSSVGSGGFGGDVKWIVDSGASNHMTRI
jgi:gag-polypeptide of LTR copia-type